MCDDDAHPLDFSLVEAQRANPLGGDGRAGIVVAVKVRATVIVTSFRLRLGAIV